MRHAVKWTALGMAGLVALAPTPRVGAAQSPPVLAVVPFEDGGSYGRDDEEFAGLRRGIAAMLASELARAGGARVVERDRVARLLAADGLTEAPRLDGATVARIGKAAGAGLVVSGTFIDLYGDVRVDARLVDAGDGRVLKVVRSDPKLTDRRQLYRIIQSVAERLAEAAGLPPAGAAAGRPRALSTEALTDFGRGLLYLERGETARAEEFLTRAAGAAPDFSEAREALRAARSPS